MKSKTEIEKVSTNLREDGVLEIYVGNCILAEITDGRDDEDFVEEILNDMGFVWNADGSVTKV